MSELNLHPDTRISALQSILRQLELTGAADVLETRLDQAKTDTWAPEQLLARLLADELNHRATISTPRRLTIGADARWFQIDGRPAVSLVRRTALRRLLLVVLNRRAQREAASVQDMIQAGWPRENLNAAQGATRVYTAIRTLRRMGLENILLTTDRGYEIAAEVDVVSQAG
ncbi:MAG: hypothetical protein AAF449_07690 [Myxococcota bacterium]